MKEGVGGDSLTEWYTHEHEELRNMTATASDAITAKDTYIEETEPAGNYSTVVVQQTDTPAVSINYEPALCLILLAGLLAGILLSKTLFRRM